jgi:hypothetical protein
MYNNKTTGWNEFNSSSNIEKNLGVAMPPLINLIHEHPNASLYDAAQRLIQTHACCLQLLDNEETGHQVFIYPLAIVSSTFKFIAIIVTLLAVLYLVFAFQVLISSWCTLDIQ